MIWCVCILHRGTCMNEYKCIFYKKGLMIENFKLKGMDIFEVMTQVKEMDFWINRADAYSLNIQGEHERLNIE